MGCSSSSLQQPQSGSGQDNTANQNTPGSNGSPTEQAPSKSNENENIQSAENEVGHDDGMGTGSLSESNQKEEGDSGGHSIQTVSQSKSKESTSNSESQSKSPSTKGSSENNVDKVLDAKSSGTSGSKVSSEKMSTTSESSAKPSANTSNTSAVPSSQSKQSNNTTSKIESQNIDADQVDFNSALRAMCRLVRTDELYANVKPGVWSLHLERIPPNPDFSMATLVSKIKNLVELDFSGNRLGPQGFRTAVLALIYNHSVTTLNISNNQADTDSSQCLGELLSNNSTLTWLDVSSNNLGKDFFSRSVGSAIKTNHVLKCLRFSSCGSTDLNVFLESLSENSSIVELDFSHNQMSNGSQTGKLIADVLTKTTCCLEVLEMKSTGIDANGMKSLSEGLLGNKTLKKFNAGGNEIATGSGFTDLLQACVCHPSLYALSLDDSKITDKDQTATGTAVKTDLESHLTTLSLVNCNLTDDIIVPLTNQKSGLLVNLTSLDLTNNPDITMATLKSFQQASTKNGAQCSIEEIHLGLDNIEEISEPLGDGSVFPNLHSLDLRKAKINPSTVGKLSQYFQKPNGIKKLCLDGLKLSASTAITELLKHTNDSSLQSLSMSGCALSDSDLSPLVDAIKQGLLLHMLRLSTNRLSDSPVSAMVEAILSHGSYPLEGLDLSQNKISTAGAESLCKLLERNKCTIHSLSVSGNNIDVNGLQMLASSVSTKSTLRNLECRDQKPTFDEDDMTQIFTTLAKNLGYTIEEDNYGNYKSSTSSLPQIPNGLLVNVSGLGGFPGPLGQMIDSQSIRTDSARIHPPYMLFSHVLELCAAFQGGDNGVPTLTAEEWNMIIGVEKNTSVPSWLQVSSHRDCAVLMTNLSANVSESKLEGVLETEADCSVKEVCLVKDVIMKKPTGVAWVLMINKESVQSAIEWYHSGQAILYGQSFTISSINVKVLDSADTNAAEKARLEMLRRQDEKKVASAEHKALIESAYQTSQQRHEYAKAHPAYADGRVW